MSIKFKGYDPSYQKQEEDEIPQGKIIFKGYGEEPFKESTTKSAFRTAYQPVGGALEFTGLGQLGQLMNLIGTGESLAELDELEERLPHLKKLFPHANFPEKIDREKYLEAVQHASQFNPFSVSGLEEIVEGLTGAPLTAKTRTQEKLRLGGAGAKISPGKIAQKTVRGILAPTIATGLEEAGVPKPIADVLGLGGSQARIPKISPSNGKSAKQIGFKEPVTLEAETKKIPLSERAKEGGKDIGLRPTPPHAIEPLVEDIGREVSPQKFRNTSTGGRALKDEVLALDDAAYKNVNKLYQTSRELNKNIQDIHPELADKLNNRLNELKQIPEPSGPQKDIIRTLENIEKRLVTRDPMGAETGFRPISNQTLIDQIQSLRQKIDYDFAHGNTRNLFKPIIQDLQNAVLKSAEQDPAALKSFNDARAAYRQWAEEFDNDYIRPLRNKQNKDYSKIFKGSQDIDEIRQLTSVLDKSNKGKQIQRALLRDLVENKLKPQVEDLSKFNQREFEKALRELEDVLTEADLEKIRGQVAKHSKRFNRRAEEIKLGEKFTLKDARSVIATAFKFLIGRHASGAKDILTKIQKPENIRKLNRLANNLPKKQYSAEEVDKIFKKFAKELD